MRSIFLACIILVATTSTAQTKLPPLDASPMDMSYYPAGYPVLKIQDKPTEPLAARIVYSRPQKNNRVIFGELIEYGKVWRMGANEATELELFQNAKLGSAKIKKGRYTLYTIPYADKWTIIINKETDTWGSFKYDEKKDLLRFDVPVQKQADITDALTMFFDKTTTGFNLSIVWDDVKINLPFTL
jgi:hypothetical protein